MRQHRSRSTLRGLTIGSFHYIFNVLLLLTTPVLVASGWIDYNLTRVYIGVGCGALWVVSNLAFMLKAQSLRCPLCMVPLFAHKRCGKSKQAKRAFGSHRLAASCSIIFRGKYRCIYCGEMFDARKTKQPRASGQTGLRHS